MATRRTTPTPTPPAAAGQRSRGAGTGTGRAPGNDAPEALRLTVPDYVVLGMVGLGAASGYAIKQMVELSIRFFWTISQAQIYPSLERLEEAGLLHGRSAPQGLRRRRLYETTPAGERALQRWLSNSEPLPFELRDTGSLKLFFADALAPADGLQLVARVQQRSAARVATLRSIEPDALRAQAQGRAYPLLTLEMGIELHDALARVCEEFSQRAQRA
jgi:PadR family transcriptional regulator, regulatory protein AphA